MSVTIQVKAERATRAQQQKNVFATGHVDLVVDGTPMARLYNFRLTYSAKNSKWFINEPSRSIDQVNPQTGMQEKRWLSQWQLFPNNKEARDQWMQAILSQVFQQVPDPTKAVEDLQSGGVSTPAIPTAQVAPQAFAPPTNFSAPTVEERFGAPPAPAAPPPLAPPVASAPPRVPSAPPAAPAAPGAPPVPAVPSGTGPAFPVPGAFQKPAGPTSHMPNSPSFPLPS